MGQMTNNNKMLINNSFCCFAIRVVYTRITVTWGIRHIDEGFLIWTIPSTYQSYEAVNRAYMTGFARIRFYSILSVLSIFFYFLSLEDKSGYMNSRYGNVRYRVYI